METSLLIPIISPFRVLGPFPFHFFRLERKGGTNLFHVHFPSFLLLFQELVLFQKRKEEIEGKRERERTKKGEGTNWIIFVTESRKKDHFYFSQIFHFSTLVFLLLLFRNLFSLLHNVSSSLILMDRMMVQERKKTMKERRKQVEVWGDSRTPFLDDKTASRSASSFLSTLGLNYTSHPFFLDACLVWTLYSSLEVTAKKKEEERRKRNDQRGMKRVAVTPDTSSSCYEEAENENWRSERLESHENMKRKGRKRNECERKKRGEKRTVITLEESREKNTFNETHSTDHHFKNQRGGKNWKGR